MSLKTHAYIISGEKEKSLISALEMTAAYLCEKSVESENKSHACHNCRACKMIFEKIHPDVLFISEEGSISVDVIRNIRYDAYIKPNDAEYKIFIIQDSENMTVQAQNALLKLIEEPPDIAKFILLTEDYNSLLPTVRSRCTKININKDGNTSSDSGAVCAPECSIIFKLLEDGDEFALMGALKYFDKDRSSFINMCSSLRTYSHKKLTDYKNPEILTEFIEIIGESIYTIESNVNLQLAAVTLLSKSWEAFNCRK